MCLDRKAADGCGHLQRVVVGYGGQRLREITVVHQRPIDPVLDHLGQAADRARHHPTARRDRLGGDETKGLLVRGNEHRIVLGQDCRQLVVGDHAQAGAEQSVRQLEGHVIPLGKRRAAEIEDPPL